MPLTGPQLLHAIKRNFGGLEDKNLDPVQEFLRRLPSTIDRPPDMRNVPYEVGMPCESIAYIMMVSNM